MDAQEKFELITRNLQEIIPGEEDLKKLLDEKKEISIYWGTMPTGSISIAYFFPMLKVADFLKAGCKVKILIADLHAALDSVAWEELDRRFDYYKKAILTILSTIGVDAKKLEFVKGSEMQLKPEYMYDMLQLSTLTSVRDAKKAASEVVKQIDNPKISGLIYPSMQALDEQYLDVDIQFGGMDQRKIMVYAREVLPKIGYNARIELINPLIRGLVGEKMSSSIENTKIDLMEDEKSVVKKINKADCVAGNPDNGIMALLRYFIFVVKHDKGEKFVIERPEKYGGDLEYSNYEEVEKDFVSNKLHPLDLKNGVSAEINKLLVNFRESTELKKLHEKAYGKK
ncbi:tyrosine--tRNA ligase [Candidatus Pacearchaeota archaeon]|nr:tyrosine--tRNA ligase [Candidatus Pacearchaeota archaeon]